MADIYTSEIAPSGIGRQNHMLRLKVGVLRLFGRRGLWKSLELVSGRQAALPKPMVDALLPTTAGTCCLRRPRPCPGS